MDQVRIRQSVLNRFTQVLTDTAFPKSRTSANRRSTTQQRSTTQNNENGVKDGADEEEEEGVTRKTSIDGKTNSITRTSSVTANTRLVETTTENGKYSYMPGKRLSMHPKFDVQMSDGIACGVGSIIFFNYTI